MSLNPRITFWNESFPGNKHTPWPGFKYCLHNLEKGILFFNLSTLWWHKWPDSCWISLSHCPHINSQERPTLHTLCLSKVTLVCQFPSTAHGHPSFWIHNLVGQSLNELLLPLGLSVQPQHEEVWTWWALAKGFNQREPSGHHFLSSSDSRNRVARLMAPSGTLLCYHSPSGISADPFQETHSAGIS